MAQAYCFKCKVKVEINHARPATLQNGRAAIQGICPNCATKVFRIGKG
jgi:hypothetical protein